MDMNFCDNLYDKFKSKIVKSENITITREGDDEFIITYPLSYIEEIENLKKLQKQSSLSWKFELYRSMEKIKIHKADNAIFVTLRSKNDNLRICDGELYNIKNNYGYDLCFAFFIDGHVMKRHRNNYIPASFKSMVPVLKEYKIFILFFETYLELMSLDHPVFKDFLRDMNVSCNYLFVPIPLNRIIDDGWYSYQEIFENYYKIKYRVPKKVNSMCLREAYAKVKACKYIDGNEIQKIMEYELPNKSFYDGKDVIESFLCEKLKTDDENFTIHDYIKMVIRVEKKVNLKFCSFKKLKNKHDDLVDPYVRIVGTKKMTIPKDSLFRKLKLPNNYRIIKTGKDLFIEGKTMHHCVYSYLDKVNRGTCAIIHIIHCEEPYTAEIRIRNTKGRKSYYCRQLMAKWDKPAPEELWQEMKDVLQKQEIL